MMPKVTPRGLAFPPVDDEDKTIGNNGQIQGAKIVIKPEIKAKESSINILESRTSGSPTRSGSGMTNKF